MQSLLMDYKTLQKMDIDYKVYYYTTKGYYKSFYSACLTYSVNCPSICICSLDMVEGLTSLYILTLLLHHWLWFHSLSFIWQTTVSCIWIATVPSLRIITFERISLRADIPYRWWIDCSLKVFSDSTPESGHDKKGWSISRQSFTWIMNEDVWRDAT